MRKSTFKPSVARMLVPGLSDRFTSGTTWTPSDMKTIRLEAVTHETMGGTQPRIVTVRMAKGGVGKTTLVGNLGAALAMMGHKVLLIDADPQASLTLLMGLNPWDEGYTHIGELMHRVYRRENACLEDATVHLWENGFLDIIPSDLSLTAADHWMIGAVSREHAFLRLMKGNEAFFSSYDAILIDTAPATSLLTNALMLAAPEVLAVAMLDGSSVKAMEVLEANIDEINSAIPGINLGFHVVANGWHGSYQSYRKALEALLRIYPGKINPTVLPWSAAFKRQIDPDDETLSGTVMEREPNTDSAEAIAKLARSLAQRYQILLGGVAPSEKDFEEVEIA